MTPGTAQWILSFQLAPIVLCGGIAQNVPGGVMPITQITEAASFPAGLLNAGGPPNLDDYFANFAPLPGATLGENQIGEYPFANQSVAANALIAQPLTISMLMICPARQPGGYATALATMMSLAAALNQHDSLAGTYTIVTPRQYFTDCVRLRMVDVSSAETHQAQNSWQLDFRKPLLTLEAAQAAQNTLMAKMGGGTQIVGQPGYSGSGPTVGQPSSLAGTSLPSGAATAGAGTAPLPTPPIPPSGGGAANQVLST